MSLNSWGVTVGPHKYSDMANFLSSQRCLNTYTHLWTWTAFSAIISKAEQSLCHHCESCEDNEVLKGSEENYFEIILESVIWSIWHSQNLWRSTDNNLFYGSTRLRNLLYVRPTINMSWINLPHRYIVLHHCSCRTSWLSWNCKWTVSETKVKNNNNCLFYSLFLFSFMKSKCHIKGSPGWEAIKGYKNESRYELHM